MTIAARNPIQEAIAAQRQAEPGMSDSALCEAVSYQLGIPEQLVADVLAELHQEAGQC